MPQSLSQIYLHIVFSTKNRKPFLRREIRGEVHAYLHAVAVGCGCGTIIVGGVEDHVHMLCRFTRTITVAKLVEEVKRSSSFWIKQRFPELGRFTWQRGYGAFSIGQSQVEAVRRYIARQEEHHHMQDFQTEYRTALTKYNIEFDERYVWD